MSRQIVRGLPVIARWNGSSVSVGAVIALEITVV